MQSLRTPIPARHTPPLLAANPAPRPLASCKVCVPIIMVLRDYYPKVCENTALRDLFICRTRYYAAAVQLHPA